MCFKKYKAFGRNFLQRSTVEFTDIILTTKGSYFAVCMREKNSSYSCSIKIWDPESNTITVKVEEYVVQKNPIICTGDHCGIIRRPDHFEPDTGECKFVLKEKIEKKDVVGKQKKLGGLRLENGYLYSVANSGDGNASYSIAEHSPCGDFLAVGFDDGRVELWEQVE